MAVFNISVFSLVLAHEMDITVVLPDECRQDEKLKCVWLYHGGSGDHVDWLYHTRLTDYVNERHFAAVLPNVHESCFVDMNIGDRYGTYVGKELPGIIRGMFRIISDKREDNYVAGFSNGGYGCLHTALTYPQDYSAVGAFSAGDKADADYADDGSFKSINRVRLYGDGDIHDTDYCLTHLADKVKEQGIRLKIYHACGSLDPWLDMNHIVRDYFLENKEFFDYTYDEMEGLGHEWDFWEEEIKRFLDEMV